MPFGMDTVEIHDSTATTFQIVNIIICDTVCPFHFSLYGFIFSPVNQLLICICADMSISNYNIHSNVIDRYSDYCTLSAYYTS